ncbi:MAG TPA: hypothetical protein PKH27_15035 [Candidatus Desulfobacillus denitrificans]|nr:hypothetical protein [Gammaproteobacteria bacterium]HNQ58826.1 hypothetical protein [Candidatus Desulfobacillus denitrificans]
MIERSKKPATPKGKNQPAGTAAHSGPSAFDWLAMGIQHVRARGLACLDGEACCAAESARDSGIKAPARE